MSVWDRVKEAAVRAVTSEVSTVEAAGLANAVASVAVSFDRGLLPRTFPQQAGLTGLWSALTYGMTATTQSFIEAGVRRVGGLDLQSPHARRAALMTGDGAAVAVGLVLQKSLAAQPDEPMVRAAGRAAGWRLTLTGVSGLIALAADGVHDTLRREHHAQSVNTIATLAAGTAVAGGMYLWRSRKLIDNGVDLDQFGEDVAGQVRNQPWRAAATGVGVSTGIFLLSRGERYLARTIAEGLTFVAPATEPYALALGHAITFTGITVGAGRAIDLVYRQTEGAGSAIEPAYAEPPESDFVSGGPSSEENWHTFGREGRRYVNMALTADEVQEVTGQQAINPIRAYVGLEAAANPNRRAARAMRELELLGGFDREYIAVFFPTGTGYVNYVALEALEYFTGGDIASVAIQYSVRPSFLSLGEVGTARESNLLLLNRLAEHIGSLPEGKRPKLLLFGESLGSEGGQDVLAPEGTNDLDWLRVHRALFIGTPFASTWRQRWLATPEVVDPEGVVVEVEGIEQWRRLESPQRDRARVVLLTHGNDPIPKFGGPLLVQEPRWLGPAEERPDGVPAEMVFLPGLTFLSTAIDLLNADNVKPGTFDAYAHDYRADLAEMVRATYGLPVSDETMSAVETALRQREFIWAERRLVAETLSKTEEQIRQKVTSWGIDDTSVPRIVQAKREVSDPYAVTDHPDAPATEVERAEEPAS